MYLYIFQLLPDQLLFIGILCITSSTYEISITFLAVPTNPLELWAKDPLEPLAKDPLKPWAKDPLEPWAKDPLEPLAKDPLEPWA